MERIPMDKESIERIEEAILRKETELAELSKERTAAALDNHSDERLTAISNYRAKELMILAELRDLREKRALAEVYTPSEDSEVIDLGDYVRVDLMFDGDTPEEYEFRLLAIGTTARDEISIDSPLGNAVYGSKVGDMGSYQVNNLTTKYFVKAKSKTPFEQLEEENIKNL